MPLATFSQQLDDMVRSFADVKGLILDIRINGPAIDDCPSRQYRE